MPKLDLTDEEQTPVVTALRRIDEDSRLQTSAMRNRDYLLIAESVACAIAGILFLLNL